MADRRAFELGVHGTEASLRPDTDRVRFPKDESAMARPASRRRLARFRRRSAGQTSDDLPASMDSAIVSQVGPGGCPHRVRDRLVTCAVRSETYQRIATLCVDSRPGVSKAPGDLKGALR